jgi:Asp-tRNA(Asn)/Glu-tRNA(Gln) amidotransferase A subunit family amidase
LPTELPTELADCSATELLWLYQYGQASPVEATRAVLARIDACDPMLNAFRLVDAESAMTSAHASEARWHAGTPIGILDRVPASIKDLILTRGWSIRSGLPIALQIVGPTHGDAMVLRAARAYESAREWKLPVAMRKDI